MPSAKQWATRFGARRRALDKAYCQEAEKSIACMPPADEIISFEDQERKRAKIDDDARAAIARAFGRPLK